MSPRRLLPGLALVTCLVGAGCASTGQAPTAAPSPAASAAIAPRPTGEPHQTTAGVPPEAAARPPLPVRLVIPAIQVDASVEQVGRTPDGAMDVPKESNDVGWYKLGFRPGEQGNAVMAGHLDTATDRAVFWDLQ